MPLEPTLDQRLFSHEGGFDVTDTCMQFYGCKMKVSVFDDIQVDEEFEAILIDSEHGCVVWYNGGEEVHRFYFTFAFYRERPINDVLPEDKGNEQGNGASHGGPGSEDSEGQTP